MKFDPALWEMVDLTNKTKIEKVGIHIQKKEEQ